MTLVQHPEGFFTADTTEALLRLKNRAAMMKGNLEIAGYFPDQMKWDAVRKNPGPTGLRPELSAIPSGREVRLRLRLPGEESVGQRQHELAMLWGVAVSLGFVPFTRYPLPGPCDEVFHFLGPWAVLMDNLLGAGRGEAGWPGFCCAAQLEVGAWEGSHATERAVQAHLHRSGFYCGAVDGQVGPKTQAALKAANLHSLPLTEILKRITAAKTASPGVPKHPVTGHLEMEGVDLSIHPYGQVRASRTARGADIQITGPGRLVIDVRDIP